MEVSKISLEQTGRFNRLMLDYVNGDEKLKDFIVLPNTIEAYKEQIERRKQIPINRELLAGTIAKQYKTIGGAEGSVKANIESLTDAETFTVTTGHQLNIFTGPLYFIYKILHTIRLAEELQKAYPAQRFVPIYWMNSEDHDLEEIGQFNLFGKNYTWNTQQTGATGRMKPDGLTEFCSQLHEVFSNNEGMLELLSVFQKSYGEFDNLSDAARYFVNQLFDKYGLVIIDSDDAELKRSFIPQFKEDIIESKPFQLVKQKSLRLQEDNYHVQVNPREINTFYLTEGARERIVRTDKGFHVLHTDIRFTQDELEADLEKNPQNYSPNVVLRPLFQELVLPNLAYVGGAGELSYWLQYQAYFNEMGVSYPILSLRNHFLLIDGGVGKKMNELKLLSEDLFHSVDDLVKNHLLEVSDTELDFSEELKLLSELYSKLKGKAVEADPTLVNSLEAEETRQQKAIEQWGSRFTRALKKQNEVSVNQIKKLHAKLFPKGYLQERHENFMNFRSKYGDGFMDAIHSATEPFETEFTIIRLS